MPNEDWLAVAIISALCVLALLEKRYRWARKAMDFIIGKEKK